MGISITRKFEYVKPNKRLERLTDYYFWALEDLRTRLPFICERPQKDIGCINGKGEDYRGTANIGESGDRCQPWDSPYLRMVLDESKIQNLGDLQGNNYCRQILMLLFLNHFPHEKCFVFSEIQMGMWDLGALHQTESLTIVTFPNVQQ